jgi:hypothetical protein
MFMQYALIAIKLFIQSTYQLPLSNLLHYLKPLHQKMIKMIKTNIQQTFDREEETMIKT